MNKHFLTLVLASGLAACASPQRTEPPAPIVSATTPAAESARAKQPAPLPPPPEEKVEVYPYKPPSSAPDALAPAAGPEPEGGAHTADTGPISEPATIEPSRVPPVEKPSEPPPASAARTESRVPAPAPKIVAHAPPPPPAPKLTPAADTLVKQADSQRRAGDYVSAAATLERALGIQPQESYIWNRLARVRMEQGLYAQAGNLASRSNVLAGDQPVLKRDNWSIIAAARRAAGDTAGAREAERKASGG